VKDGFDVGKLTMSRSEVWYPFIINKRIMSFTSPSMSPSQQPKHGCCRAVVRRAIDVKHRHAGVESQDGDVADFNFFSYFALELRGHRSYAFHRRMRNGHTDSTPATQADNTPFDHNQLRAAKARSTDRMQIELALRKSQVLVEWDNEVMDSLAWPVQTDRTCKRR
jgi:hypothetical protein